MPECHLLSLPRELRDQIWELCFIPRASRGRAELELTTCGQYDRELAAALLRTCHQINTEAVQYLYRNTIWLGGGRRTHMWHQIGANMALFRSVKWAPSCLVMMDDLVAFLDRASGIREIVIDCNEWRNTLVGECPACRCLYETKTECVHPRSGRSCPGCRVLYGAETECVKPLKCRSLMEGLSVSSIKFDLPNEGSGRIHSTHNDEDFNVFLGRHKNWFKIHIKQRLDAYRRTELETKRTEALEAKDAFLKAQSRFSRKDLEYYSWKYGQETDKMERFLEATKEFDKKTLSWEKAREEYQAVIANIMVQRIIFHGR